MFDPIDSLNEQILNAIGAAVSDQTEKQNAADAIEVFLNSNNFVKEVLNDTLRDDIKDNYSGFAIVEVDSSNIVKLSEVSPNKAKLSQEEIRIEARRKSLEVMLQTADQLNILGEFHAEILARLKNV